MIDQIKTAADSVGIIAVVSNSTDKIEVQLNNLTREEDAPIMLVSWDMDVSLSFDTNGFLQNPFASVVALLVRKPEDLSKFEAENTSKEMAELFHKFIQKLYETLSPLVKSAEPPINSATYKYVPRHGAGKHSGIMAKWNMANVIEKDC